MRQSANIHTECWGKQSYTTEKYLDDLLKGKAKGNAPLSLLFGAQRKKFLNFKIKLKWEKSIKSEGTDSSSYSEGGRQSEYAQEEII